MGLAQAAAAAKAASYVEIKSALNPPPGYADHKAGKPVFWPPNVQAFLHEGPEKLNNKTFLGIAAEFAQFKGAQTPSGTQAVLQAVASGELTASKAYEGAQAQPALAAAPSNAPMGAPAGFTGANKAGKVFGKKGLAPSQQNVKPAPPLIASPNDAPGLAPAALPAADAMPGTSMRPEALSAPADANAPAVLQGSELTPFDAPASAALLPPNPPAGQKLLGWAKGLWANIWTKPAAGAPRVAPAAPVDLVAKPETEPLLGKADEPIVNENGLLVHAPRAVRRDALNYRVHYLGLSQDDGAKSVRDQAVRVVLATRGSAEDTAELRERFGAFNRLIENNFAALELMARSSGQITVKTARALFSYVEAMSKDYGALVDKGESSDVAFGLAEIGVGFETGVKRLGLSDADLLPAELLELVMPIDKRSVHLYINRIHQGALENIGRGGKSKPNLDVMLGERKLALTDISENPLVKDGRIVSSGFKALVAALLRSKDVPKGKLVMQDHQFQGHFQLGAHSAEVYANFLPPDEGGMLRVRYQEWGTGYDNQTRLYYVARLLQKTGFHVEQNNGFLTAVVDKDHAAQSVDEMTDTFALVVQALHATVGVDFALPMLVEGATTSEEVGRRIDGWVDIVLGEGTLPFYVHDEQNQMISGWHRYMANAPRRARLRAALDARLQGLGLPAIPAGEPMGQRAIDRFVNTAIEKALARGELRLLANGRLSRVPGWDNGVSSFAEGLKDNELSFARMAEVVSSLDPTLLDYEAVGSLGGLTLERAQRRLDSDSWLTVHVLRDPLTGQAGLARAQISKLSPGAGPKTVSASGLFSVLEAQGVPVARFDPSPNPPGGAHFMRLLRAEPVQEPADRARFLGLAASPAHGRPVVAKVTYDKAKAARGGYIYMAPYTSPDDLDAIKASKAVLTTSGGLLSHAAITTREMGIPAAIMMGVTWQGGQAVLETRRFGAPFKVFDRVGRQAQASTRLALPEDAVVRLDPVTGQLEAFPAGTSAALLDAAAALEAYDASRDGRKLAEGMALRMRSQALTQAQRETLVSESFAGMAARALERPEAAGALQLLRAAVVKSGQAAPADAHGMKVFRALELKTAQRLTEAREQLKRAQSIEAAERTRAMAGTLSERLSAVGAALGRPKGELARLASIAETLDREASEKLSALLAAEIAELDAHAKRFPSATLETLPLMKAVIAKAKRRGLAMGRVREWEAQVQALERQRAASIRAAKPLAMPLRSIIDADVAAVGGKGAKLGEIAAVVAAAGGVVPNGVALTVHAYRAFLEEAGIAAQLERLGTDSRLSPDERAAQAKRLILTAKLDARSGVGRAILESLRAEGLDEALLAVRSSAVDEDGAEAAFAGAGDTHLYVAPDEVLANVQEIWASLWNPRALLYRQTKGLSTANMAQAVVLQEMVAAEAAGVAFTQDPVSGDGSRLVVNGAFGLGEGVVSNRVSPDQYVLSKEQGVEILPPLIGDKKLAVVRGPSGKGTVEQKMPPEWRRRRALTPDKLATLNRVSVALERHFGYALDIEFAFVGSKLYILQARPVTVATPVAVPDAAKPKSILFVCTGNTCRSPMAEQLARTRLAREGRSDIAVASRGLRVAVEGAGMSEGALAALAERGIDGRFHSAQGLSAADVQAADVILGMTQEHVQEILRRHPQAKGKVFTVAEFAGRGVDVADPYGGNLSAYRAAADAIEDALEASYER
jgi:protein-tyrosine-phosphatase/phosphohistidine swiveling domain-containing protein